MQAELLRDVLAATAERRAGETDWVARVVREPSITRALALWIRAVHGPEIPPRDELTAVLQAAIADIDRALSQQLCAVIHHARFRALEASWRGLKFLVEQTGDIDNLKIRVLAVTWRELARDLERAIEFDQSQLFRKVYSDEFGTPGGEPFGVLLGDYYVAHRPHGEQPVDDVTVLKGIAAVATAAFAPFIAGAHPALFGLDSFVDLERPFDIARVFQSADYIRWNSLREIEEARFVGLTLPRILMREPWRDDPRRVDGFRFREHASATDGSERLWANACYAFGAVLARSFGQSGWLASIRGVERGAQGGGLVSGLAQACAPTDAAGVAPLPPTELVVSDMLEKQLSDLGLIALCHCPGTPWAAFYSTPSLQQPRSFDKPDARVNAKLSAMLQYIFCTSRFAHYIKMIGRDRQGSFTDAEGLQRYLTDWLAQFTLSDEEASSELQARHPLRAASVTVRDVPGKPGAYYSIIHLRPHFQLDDLSTSLKLVTEIVADR
jgi:type VI secretion system protein ImpD